MYVDLRLHQLSDKIKDLDYLRRSSGLPHLLKLYIKCDQYINEEFDINIYQQIFECTTLNVN